MKKELQTSKKSLDSLNGKKLGNLKSIYGGSVSLSRDADMLATITIMNSGGTADDGCDDKP